MLPTIHLGPLAIQLPGLLMLLGLWLGLALAEKHAKLRNINPNLLYTYTVFALITAILLARLVYALRFFTSFTHAPVGLLSLNTEMLDPFGAFLGIILISYIFLRRYRINLWSFLDALAPTVAVLAVAINLSNLASGDGFGPPTRLPWAIYLRGDWRHPTQVYELIAAAVVLWILWPDNRISSSISIPGVYGMSIIAITSFLRLFFEAFRGDSAISGLGFRSAQISAWVILAVMLWGIANRISNRSTNG